MTLEFLLLAVVLTGCLIAAAGWDIATFTIPNSIQIVLLASFALFALVAGMSGPTLAFHLAAGFAGLVAGFALFAFGFIGGGDAKLFACIALWFGLSDLLPFALVSSLLGGGLTLGILLFRKIPVPRMLSGHGWIMRLHDPRAGIPYGVALAAGSFFTLPYTDIFRAGMGA